jgi:protein-disulfide isomerase
MFFVVGAALDFRGGPWWSAIVFGVLALVASVVAGLHWRRWAQTAYAAVGLVLAALAAALICAGLVLSEAVPIWPCDIACAGGGAYRHVLGIPVPWLGLSGCLTLFTVALGLPRGATEKTTDPILAKRRRLRAVLGYACAQTIGWALIGGAVFFLWTAWRLGMACRQCLAVHTAILACIGPLIALPGFASARVAACVAGFCVLLAEYGPALRIDAVAPTPPPAAVSTDAAWLDAVRQGRQRGAANAPLALAIVVDAQCQACADDWPALDRALAPLVGAGRVRLVIRPLVRPSEPASAVLADCIDAAAADGQGHHARALRALLGSRAGISASAAVATDAAQAIDAAGLAQIAAQHAAALAALRGDDARWLASVAPGGHGNVVTPFAVLSDAGGHELRRWSGADLDAAAVAATITAAQPSPSATGSAPATGPTPAPGDSPASPNQDHP